MKQAVFCLFDLLSYSFYSLAFQNHIKHMLDLVHGKTYHFVFNSWLFKNSLLFIHGGTGISIPFGFDALARRHSIRPCGRSLCQARMSRRRPGGEACPLYFTMHDIKIHTMLLAAFRTLKVATGDLLFVTVTLFETDGRFASGNH